MDLLPGLSSFFVCLFFRLEVGIAVGVFIQLCTLLYASARPIVEVDLMKVFLQSDHNHNHIYLHLVPYLPCWLSQDHPSPQHHLPLSNPCEDHY